MSLADQLPRPRVRRGQAADRRAGGGQVHDPAALQPVRVQAHEGEHLRRDPDPGPGVAAAAVRPRRRPGADDGPARRHLGRARERPGRSTSTKIEQALTQEREAPRAADPRLRLGRAGLPRRARVPRRHLHAVPLDGKPLRAKLGVSSSRSTGRSRCSCARPRTPRPTSRSATSCAPARRSARSRPRSTATRRSWRELALANAITDPRRLTPGTVLTVPRLEEARAMTATATRKRRPARELLRPRVRSSRSRASRSTPRRRATCSS